MLDTCAFNWHQLRAPPPSPRSSRFNCPGVIRTKAPMLRFQTHTEILLEAVRGRQWPPGSRQRTASDGNSHPATVNGRHRTVTAARPPPGGPLPGRWMRPSVVCYRIIFLSYPLWLRLKEPILSTDSGIIPNLKFLRIQEDSLRFLGFSASRLVTIL